MKSINSMVAQIVGLAGTKDVTEWETNFLDSISESTHDGRHVERLTDKQIEIVERIYKKHFA